MTTIRLGERICQCPGCGRHFSATSTFDQHRTWANDVGETWSGKNRPEDFDRRACLDPADVGLERRENGIWAGPPMTDEQKAERGWSDPLTRSADTKDQP